MSNYRSDKIKRYSQMFGALSNPNRAIIFQRLASCCCDESESCSHEDMRSCVGDLGKDLKIAASTVSHHIKELNRAGLIKMERCGRMVKCCIDSSAAKELAEFLGLPAHKKRPTPARGRRRI